MGLYEKKTHEMKTEQGTVNEKTQRLRERDKGTKYSTEIRVQRHEKDVRGRLDRGLTAKGRRAVAEVEDVVWRVLLRPKRDVAGRVLLRPKRDDAEESQGRASCRGRREWGRASC